MGKSIKILLAVGAVALVVLIVSLSLLLVQGKKPSGNWQDQYDLGIRYLSEGNYEEAIVAFNAAIDIDPKNAEAYLKAAEAYEAVGDSEAAKKVLEKGYAATGDELLRPQETQIEEVEEVEPEEIPVEEDYVDVADEAESLQPEEIFNNTNTITLSLEVPDLQDKYWVDKSESRDAGCEYCWGVNFTDGINNYEVSTMHFKRPGGQPREITLYEMQSNVWLKDGSSGGNICGAGLQIIDKKLLWTFSIPNEYGFDVSNIQITPKIWVEGNIVLDSNVAAIESISG